MSAMKPNYSTTMPNMREASLDLQNVRNDENLRSQRNDRNIAKLQNWRCRPFTRMHCTYSFYHVLILRKDVGGINNSIAHSECDPTYLQWRETIFTNHRKRFEPQKATKGWRQRSNCVYLHPQWQKNNVNPTVSSSNITKHYNNINVQDCRKDKLPL